MKVCQEIENLKAYKPGKPIEEIQEEMGITDGVNLASNENSLGVSPRALQAGQESLQKMYRYPDPSCLNLSQALSKKLDLSTDWVAFGNGSNESLDILIRLYCQSGDSILTSQSSFLVYKLSSQAARVHCREVPFKKDLGFDVDGIIEYIKNKWDSSHKLIFLPNPNNPTGAYLNKEAIDKIVRVAGNREDIILVFDEAYNEYVRADDYPDMVEYLKKYNNIVITRTFSKAYGLAGLRIGYILAHPEIIDYYNRVRNPFNVNALAQVSALAALGDDEFIKRSQEMVWQGLDFIYQGLEELDLPFCHSQGNFVLFDTKQDAGRVSQELIKRGVQLRPVGNYGFPNHLRMTVGTREENQKALSALNEILAR